MEVRYAHPALHGWGVGLTVLGLVLDLAGTITYAAGSAAESKYCNTSTSYSGCQHGKDAESASGVLAVFGGIFTLTGGILWLAGSGTVMVPVAAPTPSTAWLKTVTPFVSPTKDGASAGVVVSF
jgi:hypothetical protein